MKLLLALLLVTSAHAKTNVDEQDYWKGTGLKPANFIADVIPHCNDSTNAILGCLDALNGLSGVADQPLKYVAEGEKEAGGPDLGNKQIQLAYDGVVAYTLLGGSRRFITDFRKITKAEKELHYRMTEALFKKNQKLGKKIDFSSRFQTAFSTVDPEMLKTYEEAITGELYNLFFADVWDPHTSLIPAAELNAQIENPDETHKGMGFEYFRNTASGTFLAAIREDTPAMNAGLRRGDEIVSIDGTLLAGKKFEEIKAIITGTLGQTSTLVIRRAGKEFSVSLTRVTYQVYNVSSKIIDQAGVRYGYIKIRSFQDFNADEKIASFIKDFQAKNVQGIILDLRDNGGGYIETAFDIGSQFVGHKVIATVKTLSDPPESEDKYGRHPQLTTLPMVTLINGGSASASEVLSGALQAHQRSFIVGDRSFGKGTAQSTDRNFSSPSFPKNGKVKECRTNMRFYQPNGRTNQLVGILPDFDTAIFPGATDKDEPVTREEDRYLNALAPMNDSWVQPRPEVVSAIKKCLLSGEAERLYQSLDPILPNGADYRLLVAQEVLKCAQ
jgi:carboxyl-terminal processing protease